MIMVAGVATGAICKVDNKHGALRFVSAVARVGIPAATVTTPAAGKKTISAAEATTLAAASPTAALLAVPAVGLEVNSRFFDEGICGSEIKTAKIMAVPLPRSLFNQRFS
jgi:hypothetical protein